MYKEPNPRIAILYICTGPYEMLWKQFYKSFEKRFLPDCKKEYFVFTDAERIYCEKKDNVHVIEQERLGWPYDTLRRFHIFLKAEKELEQFDYIFFMNANCHCRRKVTKDEFLPVGESLLLVQHPGMYNKTPDECTYERNEKSLAFIPFGEGQVYVFGAINGGKAEAFLELSRELKRRTDLDEQNGIIAIYHDESQLNRYAYEFKNYKLLSPTYAYPEGWKLPFKKKIVILDKSRFFNDRELKRGKV